MSSSLTIISARPDQPAEVLVLSRVCTIILTLRIRNSSCPAYSESPTEHPIDMILKVGYKAKFVVYMIFLSSCHSGLLSWAPY